MLIYIFLKSNKIGQYWEVEETLVDYSSLRNASLMCSRESGQGGCCKGGS